MEGKGLMMILGKPKGGYDKGASEDKEESSEAPSLSGMGGKKAAKGVLAAIESGDVGALDKALREHYESCVGGE